MENAEDTPPRDGEANKAFLKFPLRNMPRTIFQMARYQPQSIATYIGSPRLTSEMAGKTTTTPERTLVLPPMV